MWWHCVTGCTISKSPIRVRELGVTLFVPEVVPKIETVVADSPAERAGMRAGDLVVEADGRPLESWQAWVEYVRQKPQEPIAVTVERDTQRVLLTMTPDRKLDGESQAYGYVGVGVAMPSWPESMQRTMEYGFVGAGVAAVDKTWRMSAFTLSAIKKMLMGLLSPKNLSGPITIAKVASSSAQYGFFAWLTFLALLSISLAVLNLLPIPVLDGGHIVYALVEWLTGKPVAEQVQVWANQLGLVLVVFVMIFALYNDVLRL